ncbi:MAG: 3-isopropylmalate dehydratase large subunit [Euryarchaeota archaeon]|nr:3-isopropylmalate dehydratase large subunit [Euryarchaeota archaeon]
MGMTLAEKILAAKAGKDQVKPGDLVDVTVDVAMSHEACAQIEKPFEAMGAKKVWDPDKVMITLDHWVPASDEMSAAMHRKIRGFVDKWGLEKHFYDIGHHGICHQLLAEKGFCQPGRLVLGTDSHTNTGGALGAFSAGVGPTEMAAIFATGEIWLKVPQNIQVVVNGTLQDRVYSKDIILAAIKELSTSGARYKAVEFRGDGVMSLPMWQRLTLTNMTTEMGAKTGLVAADATTYNYLETLSDPHIDYKAPDRADMEKWRSDDDAIFQETLVIDGADLEPQVAAPFSPDNVHPVSEVEGVHVDQVFIGSCTNARWEDLLIAASYFEGEKVPRGTRVIVSPASTNIYNRALKEGLIETFTEAGAMFLQSTCGPCFGAQGGLLDAGEVCASTSNRNFVGRMGHREGRVYLMSPATAAASAIAGEIVDPRKVNPKKVRLRGPDGATKAHSLNKLLEVAA